MDELESGEVAPADSGRRRKPGAGRKPITEHEPEILKELDKLVEPTTRGDPECALRWTCKSTRRLAEELRRRGYQIGDRKVADLLHQMRYSLQANAKTIEGTQHPDRNAQFEYINRHTKIFQRRGQPVISIDTKKKELVGNFKNGGREWQPQGEPEPTAVHDFEDRTLGKTFHTGSMTSKTIARGSVSESITIRPTLRSIVFSPGGNRWGGKPIREPKNY